MAAEVPKPKFLVLSAMSGVGKTFTGDYLALYHGFAHIDGDRPLLWHQNGLGGPQFKSMVDEFLKAIRTFGKGEQPDPEQWQPYFDEIAKDALEAGRSSERVVVSYMFQRREFRDYFRERVGGDVEWMKLECDEEKYIEGNFARLCKQATSQGKTPAQYWADIGMEERCGGPLTREWYFEYKRPQYRQALAAIHPFHLSEGVSHTVDATLKDMAVLDAVNSALGLTRHGAGVVDLQRIDQINLDRQSQLAASKPK